MIKKLEKYLDIHLKSEVDQTLLDSELLRSKLAFETSRKLIETYAQFVKNLQNKVDSSILVGSLTWKDPIFINANSDIDVVLPTPISKLSELLEHP
jgi:hypothetical protein